MEIAVTHDGQEWRHFIVPNKGKVVLYPDGILNVFDRGDRVRNVAYGVVKISVNPDTQEAETGPAHGELVGPEVYPD